MSAGMRRPFAGSLELLRRIEHKPGSPVATAAEVQALDDARRAATSRAQASLRRVRELEAELDDLYTRLQRERRTREAADARWRLRAELWERELLSTRARADRYLAGLRQLVGAIGAERRLTDLEM